MDWNAIISGAVAQSPITALLVFMLWRAEKRADRWETTYLSDARNFITTLEAALKALRK